MDSALKSASVYAFNKSENSAHRIEYETRLCFVQKIIVVREALIVSHVIKFVEYTN